MNRKLKVFCRDGNPDLPLIRHCGQTECDPQSHNSYVFHSADKSRRVAFTLAEVLITLGIIGVVAALTMPALIANYQKQRTVTQLKKAYSEIAQALKLAEVEYGTMDGWSYDTTPPEDLIKNYILKNLKTTKACFGKENLADCSFNGITKLTGVSSTISAYPAYVLLPSGVGIYLHPGGVPSSGGVADIYSQHLHFYVDINGPKQGTNTLGKDVFLMSANFGPQHAVDGTAETRPKKTGFWMYGAGWEPALTREDMASEEVQLSCNNTGNMCGALIQADGWEISPDYPW